MERITHDKFVKTFMDNMRVVADFIDWAAPDIARRVATGLLTVKYRQSVSHGKSRRYHDQKLLERFFKLPNLLDRLT
jgi:hypothetical protein